MGSRHPTPLAHQNEGVSSCKYLKFIELCCIFLKLAHQFDAGLHVKSPEPREECPPRRLWDAREIAEIHDMDTTFPGKNRCRSLKCLPPIGNHGQTVRED